MADAAVHLTEQNFDEALVAKGAARHLKFILLVFVLRCFSILFLLGPFDSCSRASMVIAPVRDRESDDVWLS